MNPAQMARSGSQAPAVVRLPDLLRVDVERRQPAAAVAERIDADDVPKIQDLARLLGGMTHDRPLAGNVGRRNHVAELLPAQGVDRLPAER